MKIIQYTGPFSSGQTIYIAPTVNYTYVHIGIQIPQRQPIKTIQENIAPVDIEFNGIEYRVNDSGILEFDEMAEITIDIKFLTDTPNEAIIDIVYEEKEN